MKYFTAAFFLVNSTEAVRFRPTPGSVPWGPAPAEVPTWHTPDYPVNYFVPNFGVDHNILTTQENLRNAEKV